MSELPSTWESTSLESLIIFAIGGDWGKEDIELVPDNYCRVKIIRGTEFKDWSNKKGKTGAIRLIKIDSLGKRKLKKGDIVVEISGGGPTQPVGRVILIDDVALENSQHPLVCSNFFRLVRLSVLIKPRYIACYLDHAHKQGRVDKFQTNTTNIRNLSFNAFISNLALPLPPLNEQRRIVTKIEELTTHSKRAREALEDVPKLIDQFRQSVLAAAFRGDLTAEWRSQNPDVEPASNFLHEFEINREIEYLKQCEKLKKQGTRISKLTSVQSRELLSKLPLPSNWLSLSVESASIFIVDCLHSTPKFEATGEYCIDTNCIEPFKIHWKLARRVSKEDFIKRTARLLPAPGDVLFSREGTIGTAVKVPKENNLCLGQRMMMFRFAPDILPEYAEMYLQSPFFKAQYKPVILGTTSPHLNIGEIRKLHFLIPPLNEQQQIVQKVKEILDTCELVQNVHKVNVDDLKQINQSILAKAFRGELVPQDPNDEPASVLLERIRAEREKLGSSKKATRTRR